MIKNECKKYRKFDKQKEIARDSIVYFKSIMYEKILKEIFMILTSLLLCLIFDYKIIYVLTLIILIYKANNIYKIYNNYTNIVMDIKNVFKLDDVLVLKLDMEKFKKKNFKFLRKEEYYGR